MLRLVVVVVVVGGVVPRWFRGWLLLQLGRSRTSAILGWFRGVVVVVRVVCGVVVRVVRTIFGLSCRRRRRTGMIRHRPRVLLVVVVRGPFRPSFQFGWIGFTCSCKSGWCGGMMTRRRGRRPQQPGREFHARQESMGGRQDQNLVVVVVVVVVVVIVVCGVVVILVLMLLLLL